MMCLMCCVMADGCKVLFIVLCLSVNTICVHREKKLNNVKFIYNKYYCTCGVCVVCVVDVIYKDYFNEHMKISFM